MIVATRVKGRLVIILYRRPGAVRASRVPRPGTDNRSRRKALYGIPAGCSAEVLPGTADLLAASAPIDVYTARLTRAASHTRPRPRMRYRRDDRPAGERPAF